MEGAKEGVERVVDSKDLHHIFQRPWQATASIAASAETGWKAMHMRGKELAAVKINVADVNIIENELELDKKVAERTLLEHKGDVVTVIRHLLP
ncbi:huntingtin-interacting protein K [Spatholobus suberectus]|nr:huntingtin-interacting protein K [Spatholobus suberectus]